VTKKADVYALGMILNWLFTGRIPVGTDYRTIGSVASAYAYLDELVSTMLRQDPDARPSVEEVLKHLIAQKALALSTQKINQLSGEIVPEETLDDPLVVNPITLVDVDYESGILRFKLSAKPNGKWIEAFRNQGTFQSFINRGPGTTFIGANIVEIGARENEAPQQVQYFKQWLENGNKLYREGVEREARLRREKKETELARNVAAEEERKRVLERLRGTW
jgi:serine/threonine protein kinase